MIHYKKKDNGKNDWVVFIHPLGGSSVTYYKQLKDFQKNFNLLLIDLHGHGKSKKTITGMKPNEIAQDIIDIIDKENIDSAYFVGMCLGNVVVDLIYENSQEKVKAIVYGAPVKEINLFNKTLLNLGNIFKNLMPHGVLYNLFALAMMPKNNHKESRQLFVKQAKKMKRSDFLDWFNLILSNQNFYDNRIIKDDNISKLYIFGSEDHLFISKANGYVEKDKNAKLHIIDGAGHMCNIDGYKEFNSEAIKFFNEVSLECSKIS